MSTRTKVYNEAKERDEYIGYMTYIGKKIVTSKLVHCWYLSDEQGTKIEPTGNYWYGSKFSYIKRPIAGTIYRIPFAESDTNDMSFWTDEFWKHETLYHPERQKMYHEDKVAKLEFDALKERKKEANRNMFDEMTLSELREYLKLVSLKKRRLYMVLLLDYLRLGQ